jgi:hypothetical protein
VSLKRHLFETEAQNPTTGERQVFYRFGIGVWNNDSRAGTSQTEVSTSQRIGIRRLKDSAGCGSTIAVTTLTHDAEKTDERGALVPGTLKTGPQKMRGRYSCGKKIRQCRVLLAARSRCYRGTPSTRVGQGAQRSTRLRFQSL